MPTKTPTSLANKNQQNSKTRLGTSKLVMALGALLVLGACAQQSEPNYYEISRANTQTDARHRAQGNNGSVAPSQLQIGFGDTNQTQTKNQPAQVQAQTQDLAATGATEPNQALAAVSYQNLPRNLADTRTYLGTVSCGEACGVQRMTLTVSPNGQWRARNNDLSGQLNDTQMGCWVLTNDDPVRINLKTKDHIYATLEFTQNNIMKLVRLNGQQPLLQSNLTRQADVDPIAELNQKSAENCSTHQ